MPVYTYECQSCNHKFYQEEALFQKPVMHCPRCLTRLVRRVPPLSPLPVVVLKGPGWYDTDPRLPLIQTIAEDSDSEITKPGRTR